MRKLAWIIVVVAILGVVVLQGVAQPDDDLVVVEWNMFSGGQGVNQATLRQHLTDFDGVDLFALAEVRASDAPSYETATEADEDGEYSEILGTTGNDDRLLILYDDARFELRRSEELTAIQMTSGNRAPLVAEFHDRVTNEDFLFVVVHLCRCAPPAPEARRHEQARLLNEWAGQQTLPVIITGDFNFDWDLVNGEADHDLGYDNLTSNDVFEWVRPAALATTQCDISGNGCRFNSVLDFVFVSGEAQSWSGEAEILAAAFPFPYAPGNSDHRPVKAVFDFAAQPTAEPTAEPVTISKAALLERIEALEIEIAALRALVEQMPD